jgi:cation diffusion facilitator CzcD-associated flavoprotein CzcO
MLRKDYPTIAIIGAGLAGVACAVNLTRAGINTYTVFEKADEPGGVWWYNDYPGCEVDVNSQAYSYSFMPYIWPRTHATQAQVLQYIEHTIDHFSVRSRFRFGTAVSAVRWDDEIGAYHVESDQGPIGTFQVVVSCVGMLSTPKIPHWAERGVFRGSIFHSSSFEHDSDFTGKRVAIVGTGATACQLAPVLAQQAGRLDVYQREPGYVLPKKARDFTPAEQERFQRRPWTQKIERWRLLHQAGKDAKSFNVASRQQERIRSFHERYLARIVDDPKIRAALQPTYPYGCKRPVFTSAYYPIFNQANVRLIPLEVAGLTDDGIVDADGLHHDEDIVVLATGFEATDYLSGLTVTGRSGQSLRDTWAGEPSAFLGVTVPDFPNFFILYGPNTNGGWSICAQLERQSELLVRLVRRLGRRPSRTIETRQWAMRRYDRWIERANHKRRSAYDGGCHNYYHSSSGKNVTQWPYSHLTYACAIGVLPALGLKFKPSGSLRG